MFLRKYFSLRAKAGFETQQAVAGTHPDSSVAILLLLKLAITFPKQKTLQKLAKAFRVEATDLF